MNYLKTAVTKSILKDSVMINGGVKMTAAKKLTKKQLQYFKDRLLSEKQKVLEEMDELQQSNLKQSISDSSGENSRYSYHLGDVASLSYGREFSMGLAERQQKYLEQIDEALQRIEDDKVRDRSGPVQKEGLRLCDEVRGYSARAVQAPWHNGRVGGSVPDIIEGL